MEYIFEDVRDDATQEKRNWESDSHLPKKIVFFNESPFKMI